MKRKSSEYGGIRVIEVKEVTKKFGKKKVLNGISFTAEKGENYLFNWD